MSGRESFLKSLVKRVLKQGMSSSLMLEACEDRFVRQMEVAKSCWSSALLVSVLARTAFVRSALDMALP